LRVLVVTNAYPTAAAPGVGIFNRDHVESLRKLGVQVDLLHLDRRARGRRVYGGLARRVRESVNTTSPSLVHVIYGGVTADVVTREITTLPVVVSFLGTDLLGGYERPPVVRLRRRYGVRASRRAALRAAAVVLQARVLEQALPRGVDSRRVWTIPTGVDLDRFAPLDPASARRSLGWGEGTRHLLFPSSRSRVEKRFSLAVATAAELGRRGVDVELHVLEDVLPEQVPLWINATDVVLLTSTHEGSPNAVKEALACNVPVVAVDVGDVRERLAGLTVSGVAAPNAAALADAVEHALGARRSGEGRAAVSQLALPIIAGQYRTVYATVARRD